MAIFYRNKDVDSVNESKGGDYLKTWLLTKFQLARFVYIADRLQRHHHF
jgi:hypothetical protein